jgi:hypothetical protein
MVWKGYLRFPRLTAGPRFHKSRATPYVSVQRPNAACSRAGFGSMHRQRRIVSDDRDGCTRRSQRSASYRGTPRREGARNSRRGKGSSEVAAAGERHLSTPSQPACDGAMGDQAVRRGRSAEPRVRDARPEGRDGLARRHPTVDGNRTGPGPGGVRHGRIVPYSARSPARSAAQGHAQHRSSSFFVSLRCKQARRPGWSGGPVFLPCPATHAGRHAWTGVPILLGSMFSTCTFSCLGLAVGNWSLTKLSTSKFSGW